MNKRLLALILLIVIAMPFSLAKTLSNARISDCLMNISDSTLALAEKISDSKSIKTSANIFAPPEDFLYANKRRYTISGETPRLETDIQTIPSLIVGGAYSATLIGMHINQRNAWWSDKRTAFHFQEDWSFALQVDKCGHFYGAYMVSYFMSEGLMESGFSWESATNYGSALGLIYQTWVEIEDGYGAEWGFSPSDWYADFAGALYFLGQHNIPVLQNFTPKFSYIPAKWLNEPVMNRAKTIFDDYNSSSFWLSANVYNLLPQDFKKYWLPWLNVAVGYRVSGIDAAQSDKATTTTARWYLIGLDYNLVELLPEGKGFWNWARQTLNYVKFPAPAVEISNGHAQFRLMYPIKISIGSVRF